MVARVFHAVCAPAQARALGVRASAEKCQQLSTQCAGTACACLNVHYTRMTLKYDRRKHGQFRLDETQTLPGIDLTQMGWQIYPEGLYRTIRQVWERFKKPILITENGIADDTDTQRPS